MFAYISTLGANRGKSKVYDAQVDDLLVHAKVKNGKKTGLIFDESYKGDRLLSGDAGWQSAITYMDELMADLRK